MGEEEKEPARGQVEQGGGDLGPERQAGLVAEKEGSVPARSEVRRLGAASGRGQSRGPHLVEVARYDGGEAGLW